MFFPFDANEGPSALFSYSHSGHFHDAYATHIGHYFEDATHSLINIGDADYHAPIPMLQLRTNMFLIGQ